MDWNQIVTGSLPLLGVIIGGVITYLTQNSIENKRIERESKAEQEVRNIERLKVYSEILKIYGENLPYTCLNSGHMLFYLDIFREKFRPVFFSEFYLLDQDVVDIIRRMDKISTEAELLKEVTDRGVIPKVHDELFDLFNRLINEIELKLKEYREGY